MHPVRRIEAIVHIYEKLLGNKEVENGTVSVRSRKQADMGSMPLDDFIKMALEEIATKKK